VAPAGGLAVITNRVRKVKKPHAALACSLNGNQKPQFSDGGLALGANTP
jgi:hypothetical protein